MDNAPAATANPADGEADISSGSQLPEESAHPVLAGFNRLSIVRQIGVIAGIALVIGLAIAILIWSREPSYKPLITRLQDHNAQEIIEILQREGIPFEIEPGAQILMVQAGDRKSVV